MRKKTYHWQDQPAIIIFPSLKFLPPCPLLLILMVAVAAICRRRSSHGSLNSSILHNLIIQ